MHSLKSVDCWSDDALVRAKLHTVVNTGDLTFSTLPRHINVSKEKDPVVQEHFKKTSYLFWVPLVLGDRAGTRILSSTYQL